MKLSRIIVAILATSGVVYTNITVAAPPNMTEITPPNLHCDSSNGNNTVTISWNAGSPKSQLFSYTIALNHTGNSWTYTLTNGTGNIKDLSHWVLPIPSCQSHLPNPPLPNPNPLPDGWGVDPTTQVDGAKWDTPSWSTSSTYSSTYTLTLDGNYPSVLGKVAVKSATYFGKCEIYVPDCSKDPITGQVVILDDDLSAKATGNDSTQVKFTTSYEEDIAAFRIYRGIPKVGTECTANEEDYNNLTLVTVLPSGKYNYNYHDKFAGEFAGADAICYGLVSIDEAGNDVDILGAALRQ